METEQDCLKTMTLHYEEAFLLQSREWAKLKQRLEIIKSKLPAFLVERDKNKEDKFGASYCFCSV